MGGSIFVLPNNNKSMEQQIYQVIRETANSNAVIKELNARVLTVTFKDKQGVQWGDLYTYEGTICKNPKEIVARGTCAPCLAKFAGTILIQF